MAEWNAETAEWYAEKYGEYATNRLGVDAIELSPDMVIVDVGCGTGSALRHAAARVPDGRLIGVDPVPRMIEIARARTEGHVAASQIEFRQAPAEALPVEDDSADVVFAFDSFDHWKDPPRGLAEVRRILRSGGRFIVVKDGGVPGGKGARRALLDQLSRAGFKVIEEKAIEEGEVSGSLWPCREAD